jgi:hypothetical protein
MLFDRLCHTIREGVEHRTRISNEEHIILLPSKLKALHRLLTLYQQKKEENDKERGKGGSHYGCVS